MGGQTAAPDDDPTRGEMRFALPGPSCLCQRNGRATAAEARLMVDPTGLNSTGSGALRTEAQAQGHLDPMQNEVNGVNQATCNLSGSVVVSRRGAVTVVRLSRPAKRNALDTEMAAGIETIFSSPPQGTRAIVLHGEGSH